MKKILIFGSNGKIGLAIQKVLRKNYKLFCVDVGKNKSFSGKNVEYITYDFNNVSFFLKKIYEKNNFYCVIHCQQLKNKKFLKKNFFHFDEKEFNKIININLKLTFLSSMEYIKKIKKIKSAGRIVNMCSVYSIRSSNPELYNNNELFNPIYYTISKAGVYGLTKYIAAHYKKYRVLCNSISPHGVNNNQSKKFVKNFSSRSPLGRLSQANEVIPAIKFLLDEKNTYTNGIDLLVDGGWTSC
jgi:NAD(P)-dependent dehydrogenase (short-subunit alcohol dehydrogenase family)